MLPAVLLLLTVFGPISMDLYLPVLPALTLELGAATSMAQLTVTACLVGLALGQLIAGPLSDRFGRRMPLLIGVVAFIVTSAWCAIAPSVEMLIVARFVQGLAGGVGIVIAQAAGRDLYSGAALIRYFGRVTVLSGLAAIVGPLLGGLLATVTDWRGLFVFLAGIGAVILLAVALQFTETLPAERRTRGGFAQTARDYRALLGDRRFVGRRARERPRVRRALRLPRRGHLRAAGHLRADPAAVRPRVRTELRRASWPSDGSPHARASGGASTPHSSPASRCAVRAHSACSSADSSRYP